MSYILAALLAAMPAEGQPPHTVIVQAIRHLAPHIGPRTACGYARIVRREAARKDLHAFLVLSFIHVETLRKWNPRLVGPTNDYGLTQIHVAERGSDRFLGREAKLFDPQTNIREWCRLAAMWRAYHVRTCSDSHLWWAHMKYGYRVKSDVSHALKVLRIFEELQRRFGSMAWVKAEEK